MRAVCSIDGCNKYINAKDYAQALLQIRNIDVSKEAVIW